MGKGPQVAFPIRLKTPDRWSARPRTLPKTSRSLGASAGATAASPSPEGPLLSLTNMRNVVLSVGTPLRGVRGRFGEPSLPQQPVAHIADLSSTTGRPRLGSPARHLPRPGLCRRRRLPADARVLRVGDTHRRRPCDCTRDQSLGRCGRSDTDRFLRGLLPYDSPASAARRSGVDCSSYREVARPAWSSSAKGLITPPTVR